MGRQASDTSQTTTTSSDSSAPANNAIEDDALSSLSECLRAAEDVYERYTSEHIPDDRSERERMGVVAPSQPLSPLAAGTPTEPGTPPPEMTGLNASTPTTESMPLIPVEQEAQRLPLRILNRYISDYTERAGIETEKEHYNQAETCLDRAARYSEAREKQHGLVFDNKVRLAEDLAFVYMKQSKWAEAVGKLHELLREAVAAESDHASAMCNARQNQLLATVYLDRWQNSASNALRSNADDLEMADKHAHAAFSKRDELVETNSVAISDEEKEAHHENMQLLVNILEAQGKTVEANVWREMLAEGSSTASESVRRASTLTSRPPPEAEAVGDRHDALITAIKTGDAELIQSTAAFQDLNVEKVLGRGEGKTLLMHAVECSDESTVHRLLDPSTVGANVDARNRRGRTALHIAAAQDRREMVRCLLSHDADIEAKDNDGETPLIKAVQGGHREIVQDLCDNSANMLTKNLVRLDEWNALIHAIHLPSSKVTTLLLDLAPDLKDCSDQSGKTALHHCVEAEKLDQAKAMLEHKHHLDVNAIDAASRTPLYFAASKPALPQREAMVDLLLQHGARIDDSKPPPRMREYAALKPSAAPRKTNRLSRHDSISTEGSIGTVSSGGTKLSRIFSGRMGFR
jgi:hypothetical protein